MAAAKTYRATTTIYVDERFIGAGEAFTTTAPKGATWEEVETEKPKGSAASRTGGKESAVPSGADD